MIKNVVKSILDRLRYSLNVRDLMLKCNLFLVKIIVKKYI